MTAASEVDKNSCGGNVQGRTAMAVEMTMVAVAADDDNNASKDNAADDDEDLHNPDNNQPLCCRWTAMGVTREALEEVWEEVALLCCCHCSGGGGDNNDDASGGEQNMPYTNADALSCDRRRAEGGEGNVDDGGDNEHVDVRVQGLHQVCNNDEDEEGRLYPTLRMMAMRKLVVRLHSPSGGQRRERAMSTMAMVTKTSTGVSGVHIRWIPGIGDGRDCSAMATMTMTTIADHIPPKGQQQHAN